MTKRYTFSYKLSAFSFLFSIICCLSSHAQNVTVDARFESRDGETKDTYEGEAPVTGYFTAEPKDYDGWDVRYEWRIFRGAVGGETIVARYDQNTNYQFLESGTFFIQPYVTFTKGTLVTEYGPADLSAFKVIISESNLVLPNAFSPNGDGCNDRYEVIEHKSIIAFKGTIFNRWGQKLYDWNSIDDGWDGTFHGDEVKTGVYFVVIEALGADGKEYKIKKSINLFRSFQKVDK